MIQVIRAKHRQLTEAISDFLKMEATGGLFLVAATVLAMVMANSSLLDTYTAFLGIPVAVQFGELEIAKPLLLWINDGLMAIFFFLVGLEIKREFRIGELSSPAQVALPGLAAIGGILVPAGIYTLFNLSDPGGLNGWAIPAATDIAFALAVVSLLGNRVPGSLKILLLAIAIFDDLGAIVIIAIFYTSGLSLTVLALAVIPIAILFILNRMGVTKASPYIVVGVVLWTIVLKSGVHATLAGVITAFAIPLTKAEGAHHSVLEELEHGLHRWVAFGILPLFAFANAGVSFAGIGWDSFTEPVKLGISLGLFAGKQIGVFLTVWLAVTLRVAPMPRDANWGQIYGVALLCGIGFTMSLFIGTLAFETQSYVAQLRLGVLTGSIASAVLGYLLLSYTSRSATAGASASHS
ncbi:Na+/H+ antiporter NhaA [Roseibium aggregatum]|uniref:Na(+)/H(+) antiporter NhaA n=1 Tax=Roseibium aggregatum TaxID=187304 RepID=A0A926NW06_9HYPH|nr:Na+/H+ antiporter NhaA [Roseibium aggregatum]MBD1545145.1 Na+/H+ antiporter NhaA [Roseibium aggregatum]